MNVVVIVAETPEVNELYDRKRIPINFEISLRKGRTREWNSTGSSWNTC